MRLPPSTSAIGYGGQPARFSHGGRLVGNEVHLHYWSGVVDAVRTHFMDNYGFRSTALPSFGQIRDSLNRRTLNERFTVQPANSPTNSNVGGAAHAVKQVAKAVMSAAKTSGKSSNMRTNYGKIILAGQSNAHYVAKKLKCFGKGWAPTVVSAFASANMATQHDIPSVTAGISSACKKNDIVILFPFANRLALSPNNSRLNISEIDGVMHPQNVSMVRPSILDSYMSFIQGVCTNLRNCGKNLRVILCGPYPRYFSKCCRDENHFPSNFNHSEFLEMICRINSFLEVSGKFEGVEILNPFKGEGVIFYNKKSLKFDNVHLSIKASTIMGKAIRDMVKQPPILKRIPAAGLPTAGPAVSFQCWVDTLKNKVMSGEIPALPSCEIPQFESVGQGNGWLPNLTSGH